MKKHRSIKIFIVVVLMAIMIVGFLSHSQGNSFERRIGSFLGSIVCSNSDSETLKSPDGTRTAEVLYRGCGIRDSYSVIVKYESLRQVMGGDIVVVSHYPLKTEWKNNRNLIVYYVGFPHRGFSALLAEIWLIRSIPRS